MKWKVPTKEQEEILRAVGIDPRGVAVANHGEDCFTALEYRTRNEYYFDAEELRTIHNQRRLCGT